MLWSSIVNNNVVYPYYIELALGLPQGSAKSVETQVDLAFAVLTAEPTLDAPGRPRLKRRPAVRSLPRNRPRLRRPTPSSTS